MLTEGIEEINRKEVDWRDTGSYDEPYLVLKIGDIEMIEKIIEAVKAVDFAYANDIEAEYKELDKIRMEKRKEYGDLPVSQYTEELFTDKLVEKFFDTEDFNERDVEDEWQDFQEDDEDLPRYLPEKTVDRIYRNVRESIKDQKDTAENDAWMREASYRW